MKARRIALDGLLEPQSAMQRIISVRFAEVLEQAGALKDQRPQTLHALRISCKRLRYSLELFGPVLPRLKPASQRFKQLQDELGAVHDLDVLTLIAKSCKAEHLERRLQKDRERHAVRAKALWMDAFQGGGPFAELIRFTGFAGVPA